MVELDVKVPWFLSEDAPVDSSRPSPPRIAGGFEEKCQVRNRPWPLFSERETLDGSHSASANVAIYLEFSCAIVILKCGADTRYRQPF